MTRLDFSEIANWQLFEDLVAQYFREIKDLEDNNLTEVQVINSGSGPDGGVDIILNFRVNDSIVSYQRNWIIQCKFYDNLKKSNLDKLNITTLIDEYEASGYLLICKNTVSSGVINQFARLKNNCRRDYHYEIWDGSFFIKKLYKTTDLHEHYFPEFFKYKTKKAENVNLKSILPE